MGNSQVIRLKDYIQPQVDHVSNELLDDLALHFLLKLKRHHRPTYDHSMRVAEWVHKLASMMHVSEPRIRTLVRAAQLHDLGKVAVPVPLLDKPGKLSASEWVCMDRHCTVGSDLIGETGLLEDEAYVARHHHRWFKSSEDNDQTEDCTGQDAVDLIAVCDAFDAMVSERPYTLRRERDAALDELVKGSGRQFSPGIVDAFRDLLSDRASRLRN